jgi:hypothetical protein
VNVIFLCENQVFLHGGVELWLSELSRVLQETVHDAVVNCVEDAKTFNYIDEIAQKVHRKNYDLQLIVYLEDCRIM